MATTLLFDPPRPDEKTLVIGIKCRECEAFRFWKADEMLKMIMARKIGGTEMIVECEHCHKKIEFVLCYSQLDHHVTYSPPDFCEHERVKASHVDGCGLKKQEQDAACGDKSELLCDFCGGKKPITVTYDCAQFTVPGHDTTTGDWWACCDVCEKFVDSQDWVALNALHDLTCNCITKLPADEQIKTRENQALVWSLFQQHRGVKRRVIQPPKKDK